MRTLMLIVLLCCVLHIMQRLDPEFGPPIKAVCVPDDGSR